MKLLFGNLLMIAVLPLVFVLLHVAFRFNPVVLPPPIMVLEHIENSWPSLIRASWYSLLLTAAGFIVGLTVALATALLIRGNRATAEFALAIGAGWQSYPIVALAPLLFVLFGDGWITRLIIVATLAYFPTFLAIVSAATTKVDAIESFFEQTAQWPLGGRMGVRLNNAAHSIETAVIGSAALSLVGAILAEYLAGDAGLGYVIRYGQNIHQTESMLACIWAIAFLGALYFPIVQCMLRVVLPGARTLVKI